MVERDWLERVERWASQIWFILAHSLCFSVSMFLSFFLLSPWKLKIKEKKKVETKTLHYKKKKIYIDSVPVKPQPSIHDGNYAFHFQF